MNRLILLTYLTINVFMSSTWSISACFKMVDNIQSIYDFLLRHESGEFEEYAELIKNEENINAKNSQYDDSSALHKGKCLKRFILLFSFTHLFLFTASEKGHQDIVEYLLSQGADINAKDIYGITPLNSGE
jgi:hypothetical protein